MMMRGTVRRLAAENEDEKAVFVFNDSYSVNVKNYYMELNWRTSRRLETIFKEKNVWV